MFRVSALSLAEAAREGPRAPKPGLYGMEESLRLRAKGLRVSTIALTANAMSGDRELCLAAGMNGYMVKPFEMLALETELREVVPG